MELLEIILEKIKVTLFGTVVFILFSTVLMVLFLSPYSLYIFVFFPCLLIIFPVFGYYAILEFIVYRLPFSISEEKITYYIVLFFMFLPILSILLYTIACIS